MFSAKSLIRPVIINSSISLRANVSVNYINKNNSTNITTLDGYGYNAYWFIQNTDGTSIKIAQTSYEFKSNESVSSSIEIKLYLDQAYWKSYINHQVSKLDRFFELKIIKK